VSGETTTKYLHVQEGDTVIIDGDTDVTAAYLRINEPPSPNDGGSPPEDTFIQIQGSPNRFKWQWVVEGTDGFYNNDIEGVIGPASAIGQGGTPGQDDSIEYRWSVTLGEFENPETHTATPVYKPTEAGWGILKLAPKPDLPYHWKVQNRSIEIYEDHLARDYANFGTGIPCGPGDWTFEAYGIPIEMNNGWNCHGSVWHAYDGSRNGSSGSTVNWPSPTVFVPPINWNTVVALLQRGDVVAFYSGSSLSYQLQHSHTCLTGSTMYGANNKAASGPESWLWETCTSQDWWNTQGTGNPPYPDCTLVVVYDKPSGP
jgi:hypothetical protein